MKRILIIHPSADLYGSDKIIASIASFLQVDYEVTILIPSTGPLVGLLNEIAPNIKISIYPDIPVVAKKYMTLTGIYRFIKLIVKFGLISKKKYSDYDLVYFNTLAVCPLMLFYKCRKINHVHETLPNNNILHKILNRLSIAAADRIICVSDAVAKNLYSASPNNKSIVIYNGLPTPIQPEHNNISCQRIEFALIGRIKPSVKGHYIVVDAVTKLLSKYSNFHVTFWGNTVSGQEYMIDELTATVRSSGLNDFIAFKPFTKNINEIYKHTDVTIVPSVVPDSLPTTAIESIARGIPVIGSDIGGIPEIIGDSTEGYIFDSGDADALASAMERIICNPSILQTMSENAVKKYKQFFSEEKFRLNILKEVSNIL